MILKKLLLAAFAAQVCAVASADTLMIPTGGGAVTPVPLNPPAGPKDSPEAIAKDAARDLKDSRFYNKPGATRAQYDADWQQCRLIARGSTTPSGSIPYYYNPAVVSPLAAGIGGGIGAAIAGAIIEGKQRRDNRQNCLLIRGWRLIDVPGAETALVAAMSDAERSVYLDRIVGAAAVTGKITERTSFVTKTNAALRLDTPLAQPGTLFLGKKVDAALPFVLAPGEAAIVVAQRRPVEQSSGRYIGLSLSRYDMTARDLVYQPRNWKKVGDLTTYVLDLSSGDRKAPLEVQLRKITPGDYVIRTAGTIPVLLGSTLCFGAPTFSIAAGQILYLGDFVPFSNALLPDGEKISGLAWQSNIVDSRAVLAARQPALAATLASASLRNRATFACAGPIMDRWDLPGIEDLPDPQVASSSPLATALR